ncbi:MAG: aldehyde dehydrogenase EutE, partial [Thermoguttaceae bacterium]|nr:aldehyde dehydrogenase EutE [Thermoguttaceae bacterium]
MAEISESMLRSVVSDVLAKLGGAAVSNAVGGGASSSYTGRFGLFTDANDAVLAARQAYEELSRRTMAERKKMLDCIRRICIEQSVELGTMEMNETKIGRLE